MCQIRYQWFIFSTLNEKEIIVLELTVYCIQINYIWQDNNDSSKINHIRTLSHWKLLSSFLCHSGKIYKSPQCGWPGFTCWSPDTAPSSSTLPSMLALPYTVNYLLLLEKPKDTDTLGPCVLFSLPGIAAPSLAPFGSLLKKPLIGEDVPLHW